MDNTIASASINPFPNDVRTAFQAYIQSEDGSQTGNQERIILAKQQRIYTFLNSLHIKLLNLTFCILNNLLLRIEKCLDIHRVADIIRALELNDLLLYNIKDRFWLS
jgi:hypothetical protein